MTFIWPWMLAALVLVPLGVGAYVLIDRQRRERIATLGSLGLEATTMAHAGRLRRTVPAALLVVALTILVFALARPQAAIPVPRSEGTVVLTFDVSGSMSADDMEPTRLDVAKEVARAFVAQRPEGVVIGMVAFSDGGLSVQVPTADQAILEEAIERLGPALGTSLGEGILASLDAIALVEAGTPLEYYSSLEPDPTPGPPPVEPGSRSAAAIVLLSDGENTAPPEPAEVARVAAEQGIRIHAVGLGTTSGTTLDIEGFVIHTRLDEAMLRYVADISYGTYFELDGEVDTVVDAVDLGAVYDSLGRQLVTRNEPMELTSLLAGAGIALLVAGAVLSLALAGRLP